MAIDRHAGRGRFARRHLVTGLFVLALALLAWAPARADSVADFYKGKVVKIIVSGTAEGGYAPYARMLQMHMGQYIPGKPEMIIQFMPGAGGLVATNFVVNAAPSDGAVIGAVQRNLVRLALTGQKGVKYKERAGAFLFFGSFFRDCGTRPAPPKSSSIEQVGTGSLP